MMKVIFTIPAGAGVHMNPPQMTVDVPIVTIQETSSARLETARVELLRPLPLDCVYLGKRTEYREGCGGAMCRHACKIGLPAVPGGYCQTCTSYEADI
jgi:hypothetical protein